MRSWAMLACIVVVAAGTGMATELEHVKQLELAGVARGVDAVPKAVLADSHSGALTAASPVYDRIYGCNVSPSCAATCLDSSQNGMYYEVIPIQVAAVETLECAVTASSMSDTVMTLYCDPFNPATPSANAVAFDDDDGTGNWSAFLATDAITLQPGQTYYLVVSTFSAASTGTFTVDFTSATVQVVPVELQSFTGE